MIQWQTIRDMWSITIRCDTIKYTMIEKLSCTQVLCTLICLTDASNLYLFRRMIINDCYSNPNIDLASLTFCIFWSNETCLCTLHGTHFCSHSTRKDDIHWAVFVQSVVWDTWATNSELHGRSCHPLWNKQEQNAAEYFHTLMSHFIHSSVTNRDYNQSVKTLVEVMDGSKTSSRPFKRTN